MLRVIILNVVHAECHNEISYAERHYAECSYADCFYTERRILLLLS